MTSEGTPSASPSPQSQQEQAGTPSYLQVKANQEGDIICPEAYEFVKTIGDGSFGKVKLGIHKLTGQRVAIKILCKERIKEKTDIERISRQIKIMKLIRHPFLVQMYQIIQSPKHLFLIMEFVEGGDLFDAISNSSKLSEDVTKQYFSQIVLGLEYLHGLGITHRDMKPENILIGEDGKIKIADFGLGNFFKVEEKLRTACGSPCYAPPQMLSQEEYDPRKVDIWSSGIMLYAMVHGYLPFQDDVQHVLYEKIKTKNARIASSVSIPCRNLIRGLLIKDQDQRWNITTIKLHEFLADSIKRQELYVASQTAELNRDDFNQICEHLGIMEDDHNRLFNNIRKNKHNNLTTLFYLGKKQILKRILDEQIEKRRQEEEIEKELELEKRPFTFSEQRTQAIVEKKEKISNENEKRNGEQIIKKQIQQQSAPQQSNINTPQSTNQAPQPREAPKEFQPESPLEEKPEPILKPQPSQQSKKDKAFENIPHIKTGSFQHPAPHLYASTPTNKSTIQSNKIVKKEQPQPNLQPSKKNSIYEKPAPKVGPKGQLKKSERVIMYKPKQAISKLNETDVKLYQRSQSKDKPIVLRNNLRSQRNSVHNKKEETGHVTAKAVHVEPRLIDADRLVTCSIQQLCSALSKKGLGGRLEYFSYNKQCIFVTKNQLKPMRPTSRPHLRQLQRTIHEINQHNS